MALLRRKVKDRAFSQSGSSSKDEWENEQELQTYSPRKGKLLDEDFVAVEEPSTGSWTESEKELFETQILLLQEQLTAAYVQNQDLGKARHIKLSVLGDVVLLYLDNPSENGILDRVVLCLSCQDCEVRSERPMMPEM